MNLSPWRKSNVVPFPRFGNGNDIVSFQKEMNDFIENFFGTTELSTPQAFASDFFPQVDIQETDDKYRLAVDVPGMKESDIDIDFYKDVLTIKGEKKNEVETKDANNIRIERSYGKFQRDIAFDEPVDQGNIKAELKNGVLKIDVAKKEKGKSTHMKIPLTH